MAEDGASTEAPVSTPVPGSGAETNGINPNKKRKVALFVAYLGAGYSVRASRS